MFFGLNKTFIVVNYCFIAVVLTSGVVIYRSVAVILTFFIEKKWYFLLI